MGLGRFGGGVGAARYAAQHGAEVLVTDMAAGFRRKWNEGVHAVHTTLADLFFRRKPQS